MPIFQVLHGHHSELLIRGLIARLDELGEEVVGVDLSAYSGGLDVLLGMEHLPGWRWSDVAEAVGDIDTRLLLERLPRVGRTRVLSHDRVLTEVPDVLANSVMDALSDEHWVVTWEALPAVTERRATADRIVVTGGDPVQIAIAARAHRDCPGSRITLYDATAAATAALEDAIGAPVDLVNSDRGARRAYLRGSAVPRRGPVAAWAKRVIAEVAS